MIRYITALVSKDLRISWRNPSFLVLSIIVPVVFVLVYSLVIQASATVPVAVAQHSTGSHSEEFVTVLSTMGSGAGPYFEIRTTDPDTASQMYQQGDVAGVIEIPADFDQMIENGLTPTVTLHVANINSDATKNLQLRLDHAVHQFQKTEEVTLHQRYSVFPETIPMQTYIGAALLMFGVIYSAIVNTGALFAREWEEHTDTEILLTPAGFLPLVIGKWISAFVQTLVSTGLILSVMYVTIGFPVSGVSLNTIGYLAVLFLFGASIGASLGVFFRNSLPVVTGAAVLSITLYLVSGFETYLRGIAYGGGIELLWRFSTYIPISVIVEAMLLDLAVSQSLATTEITEAVVLTLGISAVLSGIAIRKLQRGLGQ